MDPMTLTALIMAGAGGLLNSIDYLSNQGELDKDLTKKEKELKQQKDLDLKMLTMQYEENKKEALKNASLSDKQSTFTENLASEDLNTSIDNLQMQQEQRALQDNLQQMQASTTTANALSQMATSGTRNSSMNDAVEMEASLNAAQMQMQQNQQRQNDKLTLASIGNNLSQNIFNIQNARTGAEELRDSFSEGGYQQQIYEINKEKMTNSYNSAISEVTEARKDSEDFWKNTLGAITAFFGGAQQGYNYSTTITELAKNLQGTNNQSFTTTTENNTLGYFKKNNNGNYFNNLDSFSWG